MSSVPSTPWPLFSHDPRLPTSAPLRASDRDRDVVQQVLADAYADGRLDREEYDVRSARTLGAKTLGELPPVITDLVPAAPAAPASEIALASPEDLQRKAVSTYEAARRHAVASMVIPCLVTIVIWAATGMGFPWPIFVVLGTGMNVLRVLMQREALIAEERQRLERKQRKALGLPKQKRR